MKKNILFMLLLTFLVTGCNDNKKIHCAYYEESDEGKITYDYVMNYDQSGEVLKNQKLTSTITFNDSSMLDNVSGEIDSLCDIYQNELTKDIISCTAKQKGESIELALEYNYEKMTEEQKENMADMNISYEEFIQNYEESDLEGVCLFDSNKKLESVKLDGGIFSILSNSKKFAAEDSTYGVLKAAETYVVTYMLENFGNFPGTLVFKCDGNACSTKLNGNTEVLDIKGTVPTGGSISVSENGEASIKDALIINDYECTMSDDGVICQK